MVASSWWFTVTCKVTEDVVGKEHCSHGCHRSSELCLEWNGMNGVSQNPSVRAGTHRVRFGTWVLPSAPCIPGTCLFCLVCHHCPALQACPSHPEYSPPFLWCLINLSVPELSQCPVLVGFASGGLSLHGLCAVLHLRFLSLVRKSVPWTHFLPSCCTFPCAPVFVFWGL